MVLANHHEQKKKKETGPKGLKTDGVCRVGGEEAQDLRTAHVETDEQVNLEKHFENHEAEDGKADKNEQLGSAPGSAEVLGNV